MSALTSLLARDRVLSVSKIEEALTQQVLSGGDIETVLLELNFVPEDVLSAYRAALYGLLPATREEVMRASREALRQMPMELARSLSVIPILFEGRSLVVASAEPLSDVVVRQVRAQLGCELSVRIVTRLRLAAGLAHHFGVELDARTRRLADVLRKREPGVIPYVRPPGPDIRLSQRPQPNPFDDEPESREMQALDIVEPASPEASQEEAQAAAADDPRESGVVLVDSSREEAPELAVLALKPELTEAVTELLSQSFAEEPALGEAEPAREPIEDTNFGSEDLSSPPAVAEPTEDSRPAVEATDAEAAPSYEDVPEGQLSAPDFDQAKALAAPPVPRPLAGFQAERPNTIPPNAVSQQIARALRGPVSQEHAEALLAEATQRDDVLFILLRYVQQFFDFVAIFSVTKDEARGRMAHGAGLSQELMEHLVIPLSDGGFAARAIRTQRPLVGDWGTSDEERAALALLGRPAGRPGLAVPITLGSRVALLVYADRLGEGLSVTDAGPLVAVVPALGEALRRLILEQKTLRGALPRFLTSDAPAPGSEPPPVVPVEVAAPNEPNEATGEVSEQPAGEDAPELSYLNEGTEESLDELGSYDEPEEPTDGLTAVDLQAVSRLSFTERKRVVSETLPGVRSTPVSPEVREAARGRVPGVPRSAPPPPARESLPPAAPSAGTPSAHGVGAYSYVAPVGSVAEESIRSNRQHGAQPAAASVREAREAAAAAVQPSPVERSAKPEEASVPAAPPAAAEKPATPRAARLSLVTPDAPVPSMIIDMGDHVNGLVDALLRAAPTDGLAEIPELVTLGESVLPVLMQHFPGPLWVDLKQQKRRKVRGRDLSAVARCLIAFGDRAAPYVASKLSTSEPDLCRYALMVAGEIAHPDLLDAVARRTFDANDDVRAVALEVLRHYTRLPQFDAVLRAICDLSARPGKDPRRQRIALDALAELRDMRTLRTLIARLADPSEAIVAAAQRALVVLTGQDFGFAARKWEAWAEQASGSHRVEWLVEALGQQDEALRALAGEELKQLTQQYFGYHPALPKKDRDLAQRKYREWWEREGRALFTKR